MRKTVRKAKGIGEILLLGALVLFLYLAMEWLFIVTKPSFTGMLGSLAKLELLVTGYALVAVPFLTFLALVSLAWRRAALPLLAVVLGCLFFLMVDNFLYTVFGSGTLGSPQAFRPGYTAVFAGLVWLSYRPLQEVDLNPRLRRAVSALIVSVFVLSAILSGFGGVRPEGVHRMSVHGASATPNVVFVGFDGTEADLLSVYEERGRDTTPFLRSIRGQLLVFENAFPDSGKTTGTTTAMLTGRSPLETRVGFPPQVLLGRHSFLHLPALLNELGYDGFQYAIRYYADAIDLNLREGFSQVDDRRPPFGWLSGTVWIRALNDELFFLQTLSERLFQRLRYLFFLDDMLNHYLVAEKNQGLGFLYDLEGVEKFEQFVRSAEGPFYAHLHLMSTHCCEQSPRSDVFSADDFPDRAERDLLADRFNAIRDMDVLIERIYRFLDQRGELEDTILVVYSDHSYLWDTVLRVPLLLRFPGGAHAGRRTDNILLSQVPGLLVEALGLERPPWMRPGPGLGSPSRPGEPLVGLSSFEYRQYSIGKGRLSKITDPGPPNYGIEKLSMIVCSRWYKAALAENRILAGAVPGHTAPCPEESFPEPAEVVGMFETEVNRHGLVWDHPLGTP